MSLPNFKTHKLEVHLQVLGTLCLLLRKVRREGLMSIENDIEDMRRSILIQSMGHYDEANDPVYTFISDVMRIMVSGNLNASENGQYMEAYRKTTVLVGVQESMFEVARLTLIANLNGYPPKMCMEFGRQGIPAKSKPSFQELEKFISEVIEIGKKPEPSLETDEARLNLFFNSLGG